MVIRLFGGVLALFLLAGCGDAVQLGGARQTSADNLLVGDDPGDAGEINSGVGDVIN